MLTSSLAITPLAALSRPVAGVILSPANDGTGTLVVTLPGSPKAAKENLECLLRVLPHALELAGGARSRSTQVHQRIERGEDGLEGVKDAVHERAHGHDHHHAHHHHHHHHHDHGAGGHSAPRPRTMLSQDPSVTSASPPLSLLELQHAAVADPLPPTVAARQRQSPWPLISVRNALELIFKHTYVSPVQQVLVDRSILGHVLADDVRAPGNLPSGPSTNIDGYAVSAASTPPGEYKVVTSFPTSPMPPGSVYRINTGAPLPPGTDACIMVEDTEVASRDEATGDEATVRLLAQVDVGENVRAAGSDVREGAEVLARGDVVSDVGGELGTLAFVGQRGVKAYRRPIVAVLSTGNELRDLQDRRSAAAADDSSFAGIVDSNRPTLLGVLDSLHFTTIDLGICSDSMDDTKRRLKKGAEEADVVITTGGTSMGVGDLLKPCIERELGGTVHFGRVAMKPGCVFSSSRARPALARGLLTDSALAFAGNRLRLRRSPLTRWRPLATRRSSLRCRATRRRRSSPSTCSSSRRCAKWRVGARASGSCRAFLFKCVSFSPLSRAQRIDEGNER